jgi:uncharacterized coiled-coil DUF342 family protein
VYWSKAKPSLIYFPCRATKEDGLSQQLQQQLEAKQGEVDELQQHTTQLRTEYLRRTEQIKREGDDKIAFLVQQLRQAENRTSSNNHASVGSSQQPLPPFSRPTSAMSARALVPTPINRLSDAGLSRASHDFASSDSAHSTQIHPTGEAATNTQQQTEEILRRWQSEKDRREQLEKRNGELIREVRDLRAKSR